MLELPGAFSLWLPVKQNQIHRQYFKRMYEPFELYKDSSMHPHFSTERTCRSSLAAVVEFTLLWLVAGKVHPVEACGRQSF